LRGDTESGGTEISLRAIYEGGVFRPLQQVDLPDKTHVVITVKVPKTAAGLLALSWKGLVVCVVSGYPSYYFRYSIEVGVYGCDITAS